MKEGSFWRLNEPVDVSITRNILWQSLLNVCKCRIKFKNRNQQFFERSDWWNSHIPYKLISASGDKNFDKLVIDEFTGDKISLFKFFYFLDVTFDLWSSKIEQMGLEKPFFDVTSNLWGNKIGRIGLMLDNLNGCRCRWQSSDFKVPLWLFVTIANIKNKINNSKTFLKFATIRFPKIWVKAIYF